jgi:transcriptional regulator with XRE-family HTH domain
LPEASGSAIICSSGVAYDTINKLELGKRPAHASTIRRLAEALDVEPKELMKGEN